jgi:thiol:disulfide interchange protein DsbD
MSLFLVLLAPAAPAEPELLRAEQAFRYEARTEDGQLAIRWHVADGYYLYKQRFGFRSLDPDVVLGEPAWPAGEVHSDEFFGESIVYRNRFELALPMEGTPSGATLPVEIRSQGCADIGICLPPQTWTAQVALAAGGPAGQAAPEPGAEPGRNLLAILAGERGSRQDFLPPDEAFRLTAAREPDGGVLLDWQIAPGYYLYREQFSVSAGGEPLATDFPAGKSKYDEYFGDVAVFYDTASTSVTPPPGAAALEVRYQGCAEDGICYPPTTRTLQLAALDAVGSGGAPAVAAPLAEQDRLAGRIVSGSLPAALALFFGFGLLLAFTPCVLPMVPILSGLIVGQGAAVTVRRAFTLSVIFVLAMAVTYTVAGVVVALLGHNLQATFQHPVVLATFAAVFVALALAMFGFYELQVPAALQTRLAGAANRQKAGTWAGAAVMGVLSALIVGPCVAAPLAAALIVIGQSGDPVRGGAALFALSLGMGAPLIAFGASAGRLLPKAGAWMNVIRNAFGILLLGVAAWMLERIVPPAAALALWAGVFFLAAVFLGALDHVGEAAHPGRRLAKGLGLMAMLYGAVLLVGAAAGGGSLAQPLAGLGTRAADGASADATVFRRVKTAADVDDALLQASAAGRGVMLDFYADWCVDCKRMDKYTFSEPTVQAALQGAVLLKADVTANDAEDRALMSRYGIYGPPATLFFGPDGQERAAFRLLGFVPAAEFAEHVRDAWGPTGLAAR